MKKYLLLLLLLLPICTYGQTIVQKIKIQELTSSRSITASGADADRNYKYDDFASQKGAIIKFYDVDIPKFIEGGMIPNCYIRIVSCNNETKYFYHFGGDIIEYSDLVKIVESFNTLLQESVSDVQKAFDFIVNCYVTDDNFMIGYYTKGGKANWYYYNTFQETPVVCDRDKLYKHFKDVQTKIQELKQMPL